MKKSELIKKTKECLKSYLEMLGVDVESEGGVKSYKVNKLNEDAYEVIIKYGTSTQNLIISDFIINFGELGKSLYELIRQHK